MLLAFPQSRLDMSQTWKCGACLQHFAGEVSGEKTSRAIKDLFFDFLAIGSFSCNLRRRGRGTPLTKRCPCCFGSSPFFFKPGHCCLQIHFTQRQTKPKSDSKQRINSDTIFFISSTRPGCEFLNDEQEGGWGGWWGLTVTLAMTLFTNISHPASVSSPRCGRVSPCAVREHHPDPWNQSFSGIMETASDSRGRHGRPPLWPSSTGGWGVIPGK